MLRGLARFQSRVDAHRNHTEQIEWIEEQLGIATKSRSCERTRSTISATLGTREVMNWIFSEEILRWSECVVKQVYRCLLSIPDIFAVVFWLLPTKSKWQCSNIWFTSTLGSRNTKLILPNKLTSKLSFVLVVFPFFRLAHDCIILESEVEQYNGMCSARQTRAGHRCSETGTGSIACRLSSVHHFSLQLCPASPFLVSLSLVVFVPT